MKRPWVIALIVAGVIACVCCVCLVVVLLTGYFAVQLDPSALAVETPVVVRPTATAPAVEALDPTDPTDPTRPVDPLPSSTVPPAAASPAPQPDTLQTLHDVDVPIHDVYDLAARLEGKQDVPRTLEPPPAPLQVGAEDTFWYLNSDTKEYSQAHATLRYVTDHAYFWIENSLSYDQNDLRDLATTFENQIYPTNRAFFGSEWTPGVDGDPHIYILYVSGLGGNTAGYFSSNDSYHPLASDYSNGHEMFVFSADFQAMSDEYTYGVLAHEFQHMIHWVHDRNESSWVNEGMSDLAMLLNGYNIGGHDYLFAEDPDLQLTDWPVNPYEMTPYYGAAFLFTAYFLDRFGDAATQALVAHPDNSMDSVSNVLEEMGFRDPQSGEAIHADDVFLDWVLTNYLLDEDVADGRYTYHNYPDAPQAALTETRRSCDTDTHTREVHQYGADYIEISCRGSYTLNFEGTVQTKVVPADPFSGSYAFWSNKGDESDMTLTQRFDFTGHSGPLALSYWTWYDIEENYDYLYLLASTDGENWQMLSTPSGTAMDPTGQNYGWGYTGASSTNLQWIQEEVDISQFAGQEVLLRFEYITDAVANGEGFLLDDISIPQIGYFSDFENDDGGWQPEGWARIANSLPQTFRLALIHHGRQTTVEQIQLSADNSAQIPIQVGGDTDAITLVVTGTTPYTRQGAAYRYFFTP